MIILNLDLHDHKALFLNYEHQTNNKIIYIYRCTSTIFIMKDSFLEILSEDLGVILNSKHIFHHHDCYKE